MGHSHALMLNAYGGSRAGTGWTTHPHPKHLQPYRTQQPPPHPPPQQRTMARSSNSAEAQLRQLRNQLRELELTHERESAAAAAALDRARKEKAALAMGLAAVAQQAVGARPMGAGA